MESVSVFLIDDKPIFRMGIRALLEQAPGLRIVAEAEEWSEVKRFLEKRHSAVFLLGLEMWETIPKWFTGRRQLDSAILVFAPQASDAYVARMLDMGVAGCIPAHAPLEELINAIYRLSKGEIVFSNEQLIKAHCWRETVEKKWVSLTDRERQLFRLIAMGMDNQTIALKLKIAMPTTAYHITHILSKLGLRSRQEALIWAVRNLPPSDLEELIN